MGFKDAGCSDGKIARNILVNRFLLNPAIMARNSEQEEQKIISWRQRVTAWYPCKGKGALSMVLAVTVVTVMAIFIMSQEKTLPRNRTIIYRFSLSLQRQQATSLGMERSICHSGINKI
ncbi:hypothetical protein CEXT_16191 [Caerostris extrusa]|uniref:Uncharacterized protein n=1 Tax=Caerostris extrusa TaxID=172846 RepID=A0AAV4NTB4_CAEEX|nr:hypothetical protein CEXT_16191 [Caerostris extrusa]